MYIPIKVTTDYSILESMITVPNLLLFLKKYNIPACGICDKNLFGVMEFYNALAINHIKPLIGVEVPFNNISLYLYARNYEGYQSLIKLSSLSEEKKLKLTDIESYQENINVILPYSNVAEYSSYDLKFEHLYLAYETSEEKKNALLVTEHVIFCPNFKAFSIQDGRYLAMLKAIDLGESVRLIPNDFDRNTMEYYLKEDILDETQEFVDSCNVVIPKNNNYIPKFSKDVDSVKYLIALATKGLTKRLNGRVSEAYTNRLNYELSVIQKMGFEDYFLIVYDYVKFAKQNKILVGVGRGSAVGSLVSYCLGITDVDPLEYNLLFERFLNPERVSMPDIDIDFEDTRRGEVIDYVKSRYGVENVANILTFGTLKSKLALRSVGKALEINSSLIDAFVSKIDARLTLKENLENKDVFYYVEHNKEIKEMYTVSMKIEGLKKNYSTHAAGVVISSVPLNEVIPVHKNGSDILTGVTMNYLEDLGLLKMDFLSIQNLNIMSSVLKLIEENTGEVLNLNKINLNDKKVLELFTEANTVGIFQFESEGMKSFLRKLKPSKFLDLVSAIAIYRPGPMDNIDTFVRRKEGIEKIDYLHPDLKPILEETYGIIVYQEQIMQILVKIGGFTFAEADTIRRAMSKKNGSVIALSREKFISGALERGYENKLANTIYDLILKFANFGFNKSHSVSYALFGYQMAYLKTYYPIYYLANLLNRNLASTEKTKEYLALVKKSGILVLPPHINESDLTYRIRGNTLRIPFGLIHGLGGESVRSIVESRGNGYSDFFDFVKKTYNKKITKKMIESLISASCFDEMCDNHNSLRKSIDIAMNYAMLSADLEEDYVTKPSLEETPRETLEERRKEEYNIFGFYISNHPASKFLDTTIMKLENIEQFYNKHIKCVVLVERIKELTTKKGETMAFLTASDETDTGNFVVFASVMKDLSNVEVGDLISIDGRIARRFLEYQINVNKIEKIHGGI